MVKRSEIEAGFRQVQDDLVAALEACDGSGRFGSDEWSRPGGGGGLTRILTGSRHLEKAAVNFSAVHGETPEALSERLASASDRFYATGVSVIVHPRNPYAPTFHANVRYFEAGGHAWFGGGADLTPYYLFEEDASHFHRVLAAVCGRHAVADYEGWKKTCDEYFRLHHRNEARGIGGIFFDHLTEDLDAVWRFQQDLAKSLPAAYVTILERRVDLPYGEEQARWHRIRRGRYVEFNLVWDRGTRFGLETGGRTESILASLPPVAEWEYLHVPEIGSPEAELLELLSGPPRDWA
jgi:coproporphyrinogen III oxidase